MTGQERPIDPLPYRLRFRPQQGRPGAHRGLGEGSDGEFLRHVPLVHQCDPRRIDFLTSIRDPFGRLHIRTFAPRRAVPIIVVADLSASMGFCGESEGPARLAEFARLIAATAYESGDTFGLICADEKVREEMLIPPTRRWGLADEVYSCLATSTPRGRSARGLAEVLPFLPGRRSLVFLVSDFLMLFDDVSAILESLWRHDVVPVVMRDKVAEGDLPTFGFVSARDLETGRGRLLFVRRSLRASWQRAAKDRLDDLERIFVAHKRRAFHLVDRLDVDALVEFLVVA